MNTKKKATLAIIPAPTPATLIPVPPKVTKAEVIAAAVERAREQHAKMRAEYEKKSQELQGELESATLKVLKDGFAAGLSFGAEIIPSYDESVGVYIQLTDNRDLSSIVKRIRSLERPGHFDAKAVASAIRTTMDNTKSRVEMILSHQQNVEALDLLLTQAAASKKPQ